MALQLFASSLSLLPVLPGLIIVFGLYALVLLFGNIYLTFFGPLSKFPGPTVNAFSLVPFIRSTWNGNEGIDVAALHDKYGPVVRIGPTMLSFVGCPQTWKDIYGFQKIGRQLPHKDKRFYLQPINGVPSIITANDADHARQRKSVANAFSDKALKEQEPLLKKWAELLLVKLKEKAVAEDKIDMVKMLNCTTFDIMADLTFAEPLYMLENSSYSPWVTAIFASFKKMATFRCLKIYSTVSKYLVEDILGKMPSLRAKQMRHWRFTTDRVDKRLANPPRRPDLWSRILEKGEDRLSRDEQHSNASLFMIAGTETTATLLSGSLYYLSKNPEQMARIKTELRDSFQTLDGFGLESLAQCRYMEAVLKETLRLYPPVPVGTQRQVPKGGATIAGHFLPEGANISIPHLATYRNSSMWTDPDEFVPERWLGDGRYEKDARASWEPFLVGPRNCVGKNLAWHEMRLLLATTLLYFDFALCKESEQWHDQKVYTLWEKPPLWMKLTPVKA
ncbi:uncharacterized protein HMPREF1541_11073 [Cyphellophora europaea CBS 101466]|uniref:Cytochrome P450 monooxygenase n=1 Tax=Cyphellophora europaea (strain CBS 101466) TaxID=1220924 RepID=W2S5I9_CYPE1|nr:uncharacterized protein HMPREF1541_11073 [Cyphellophora europaea CBS 101466]ETN43942.1 hypothetical protein HMPREF1541_11073 [Cyphellophora europaea CBS 101466]